MVIQMHISNVDNFRNYTPNPSVQLGAIAHMTDTSPIDNDSERNLANYLSQRFKKGTF